MVGQILKVNSHLLKAENKRDRKLSFLFAWGPGKRPILATAVAKTFRRNRQTDLTFMLIMSSKLYFDAVYQERKYGREDINKETGEIQN